MQRGLFCCAAVRLVEDKLADLDRLRFRLRDDLGWRRERLPSYVTGQPRSHGPREELSQGRSQSIYGAWFTLSLIEKSGGTVELI